MTATLPYIVLAIFFVRAVTLKGSVDGIIHMFKPQVFFLDHKILSKSAYLSYVPMKVMSFMFLSSFLD